MDPAPVEIEVEARRPAEVDAGALVVPVDERLPPGADVGDALAAVPGAVVRRLGGLGSYAEVTLRGSTSRQVEVQLDGIPLDPDGASVTSLADLPLWALREIRVWRAFPPVSAGPGGVGGVVDLVTTDVPGGWGAVAAGSHGTQTGRALAVTPSVLASVDLVSTGGGFTYLADGGTPFTTLDDRLESRENADKRQVTALARARGGGRVVWTALDALTAREEGIPGFTAAPTSAVRYAAWRNLAALEAGAAAGSARWTARGWSVARREALDDPRDEIGLGTGGSVSSLTSGGARVLVEGAAGRRLGLTGLAEGRFERWSERERLVARGAFSGAIYRGPLVVTPMVWGLVLADRSDTDVVGVFALPRLGATWAPGPVTVDASVGRSVRPPDPDELFGDRGAFVGNPELRPEDAWQVALGLARRAPAGGFEAGVFWREVVDLVAFVQDAAQVARPVNLDRATVRGVDLGATAGTHGLSARAAATLLDTVNRSELPVYAGNALPRLPAFELEVGATAERGPVQLGYTGSFTAGNWLDQANFQLAPPRVLHGAFARVDLGGGWSATADVRNLTDAIAAAGPRDPLVDDGALAVRAITDFTGYPLPGRTVIVGVEWSALP